jgi:phytoene synthase
MSEAAAPLLTHPGDGEHVRRLVERSGTSFYWAMRLLPPEKREAMFAIYAFCRDVDDIADDLGDIVQRQRGIADWRDEIDRLFEGRPTSPISRALQGPIETYALPKEEFLAMLDGMSMDAEERMVAPTLDELLLYCRCVAGAVGMLSVRVFGDAGPEALKLAVVEGEALQLTNILRDLGEDAARGRLYLPREHLEEADINFEIAEDVLDHPRLPQVCQRLAALAEERFQEAECLIGRCDRRALRPAVIMLEAYHRLLAKLRREGWRDPRARLSISRLEKLWVAARYGFL